MKPIKAFLLSNGNQKQTNGSGVPERSKNLAIISLAALILKIKREKTKTKTTDYQTLNYALIIANK